MDICFQALEWMNARLDGEATPQEEALLEAHLADCPRCRTLFQELIALHQGAEVLVVPPPAGFSARVMAAVAQSTPTHKKVVHLRSWRSLGALAAVCALALLGSGALRYFQVGQQPQDIPSQGAASPALYGVEGSAPELQNGIQPFSIPPQEESSPEERLPRMAAPPPQVNASLVDDGTPEAGAQPVTPVEALELLIEHTRGDLGDAVEMEPLDREEIGYTVRLREGDQVVTEGALRYTDRSSNGLYHCFTWEQDGGEIEYAVSLTGQSILCETDTDDGGEAFCKALSE